MEFNFFFKYENGNKKKGLIGILVTITKQFIIINF